MLLLNNVEVKFGCFPNGETNLPIDNLTILGVNIIKWVYEGDEEFFRLGLLKSWLDRFDAVTNLYCSYMPHSRMDRINGHYVVSLNTAASMLNNMSFHEIVVREPHSEATLNLLGKSFSEEWCASKIIDVLALGGYDSVFFPDYGANMRYEHVNLPSGTKISMGKKSRDFQSGNIESLSFRGKVGESVLIVDDLCSRGGTFIRGSKLLKQQGAKKVSLLVSYCEDNVFTGDLFKHIDKLYLHEDNLLDDSKNKTQIIKLK